MSGSRARSAASATSAMPAQCGFTLIECMIALTLGMLVIAAATALLVTAQQTYSVIDDNARIDEAGATALAALGASIRQAAYADHGGLTAPLQPPFNALFGFDNTASNAQNDPFGPPSSSLPKPVNGSDVLVTRFMATDSTGKPDRTMQNCAGTALKKRPAGDGDGVYGWSVFYIKRSEAGHEPELFCKYVDDKGAFRADAIAHGVEAMQFLYGIDRNGDGLPETFLQAAAIEDSDWKKVTAVSIALSIRGAASSSPWSPSSAASQAAAGIRHLFGAAYSAQHAAGDPGVSLDLAGFKPDERNRPRRIVRGIVMLRNGGGLRRGG